MFRSVPGGTRNQGRRLNVQNHSLTMITLTGSIVVTVGFNVSCHLRMSLEVDARTVFYSVVRCLRSLVCLWPLCFSHLDTCYVSVCKYVAMGAKSMVTILVYRIVHHFQERL